MRFRALTDLTLPSGDYVQAGSEYTTDANYLPPCHACQPLDPEATTAYYNVGPMLSDVEPWRACYTNGARWTGVPVPPPTTYWIKVAKGYILKGSESLGVQPG
jgi:hypothetical protein